MVPKKANQKMRAAKRRRKPKDYLTPIASLVTILGALVGGGWALFEYIDKANDQRVTTTLRYQQQYDAAPMWDIRRRLDTFWAPRAKDVFDAASKGSDPLSDYVITTLEADNTVRIDTAAMIDFFASLGTCLCAELCNSERAVQFFGKDAADFYALNYPYIERQRRDLRNSTYATGLATVAKAYTSGQKAIDKAACTTFK